MLGGGTGREERERTRQTWLAEDEDVWTGDIESAPAVIGSESGAVKPPEPAESSDPFVGLDIDLTGDGVDLTDILDQLGESTEKDPAAEIAELRAKLERLERQGDAERGIVSHGVDMTEDPDWMTGEDV